MNKKNEALKMVIKEFENVANEYFLINMRPPAGIVKAIQACKEALEQPSSQGLSDDEIDNLFNRWALSECTFLEMYNAIEQELKTKNGFSDVKEKNKENKID